MKGKIFLYLAASLLSRLSSFWPVITPCLECAKLKTQQEFGASYIRYLHLKGPFSNFIFPLPICRKRSHHSGILHLISQNIRCKYKTNCLNLDKRAGVITCIFNTLQHRQSSVPPALVNIRER